MEALDQLRRDVVQNFSYFVTNERHHKTVVEFLERSYPESEESDGQNAVVSAFRAPSEVSMLPFFLGDPPRLIPMMRAVLLDQQNEPLLDMTLDWYDLGLLVATFAQALAQSTEAAKSLMAAGQISLPDDLVDSAKRFMDTATRDLENARTGLAAYEGPKDKKGQELDSKT